MAYYCLNQRLILSFIPVLFPCFLFIHRVKAECSTFNIPSYLWRINLEFSHGNCSLTKDEQKRGEKKKSITFFWSENQLSFVVWIFIHSSNLTLKMHLQKSFGKRENTSLGTMFEQDIMQMQFTELTLGTLQYTIYSYCRWLHFCPKVFLL